MKSDQILPHVQIPTRWNSRQCRSPEGAGTYLKIDNVRIGEYRNANVPQQMCTVQNPKCVLPQERTQIRANNASNNEPTVVAHGVATDPRNNCIASMRCDRTAITVRLKRTKRQGGATKIRKIEPTYKTGYGAYWCEVKIWASRSLY